MLRLIRKLNKNQLHDRFWDVLNNCLNANELLQILKISADDLNKVNEQIVEREQKLELQKKKVKVCGFEFLNSEDNMNKLWDHINGAIDYNYVEVSDLSKITDLNDKEITKRRKKHENVFKNRKSPKDRMSQAEKNLIGLTGEIHAFRSLKKTYGSEIIKPSSWISENSRYVYPGNNVDDGFGCDFIILKIIKKFMLKLKHLKEKMKSLSLVLLKIYWLLIQQMEEKNIYYHAYFKCFLKKSENKIIAKSL